MMPAPDRGPRNLDLVLLAAAALGAVLVLARQATYGVGLHWDSSTYVVVARNLLDGVGFRQLFKTYVGYPPLYPLLLAVVSVDVLDPFDVAGPVNAALFGCTIFVVGQYLRRRLESRFLVVWAALAIALAAPLAGLAAYALAGAAFILLVTLTLIRTETFLAEGRTSSLVWAGVWAALAWQTRYLGAMLLAAVVVMLLWQRGAPPLQRVRRAAGFALLAGAPMAAWLMRNRLVSGTFFGQMMGEDHRNSLPAVVSDTGELLWAWVTSFDLPLVEWQAVAFLGLLPAAALAAAGGVLIRERWRRRMPSGWLPCFVFGGFALVYLTGLMVILLLTPNANEERYVAPLYIPLLVTAVFVLDRVRGARAAAAAVTAALCVWAAGQIEPNTRAIRQANSEGLPGYSNSSFADTQQWISRNPLPGLIVSNSPIAILFHNDARADYSYLPRTEEDLGRLLLRLEDPGVFFVWFDNIWTNTYHDYDRAALRAASGLEPVAELADGAVFQFTRP